MKRRGKSIFFIVAALIFALTYTAFFGIKQVYGDTETVWFKGAGDIRFGIDIKGGVDATFMPADGQDATDDELNAAESVIKLRLVGLNITDYEVYTDYNKDRIIVRFPWKEGETEFNPEQAINEIGASAVLTFREGYGDGLPVDKTTDEIVLMGEDVKKASAGAQQDTVTGQIEYVVHLELTAEGAAKFAEATKELAATQGVISIWMDEECISAPSVQSAITDGNAIISGGSGEYAFTAEEAEDLANKINAGSLPFDLSAESFSTISPTLGESSLSVMVKAGIIAFILVCLYIIALYKLPGAVASIALLGQVATTIACISGLFPDVNSFTLTLPGIAGIILAIGMGVDANVITFERIKEELRDGCELDEALTNGFKRGLAPIIDGNVTVVIVAAILIGAFGPTDGIFAKIFKPIFFAFGPSTAGAIYSFGYTLLIGVVLNFVFGILATRLMLRAVSKMNMFRNPALYGAKKSYKARKIFNFIANSKKFYIGSVAVIAAIFIYSAIVGVSMDIQFKGGALLTYGYENEIAVSEIEDDLKAILGNELSVQQGSNIATGKETITVTLPGEQTVTTDKLAEIETMLGEKYAANKVEQLEVNNVNPAIGKEFFAKSIVGLVAACVLILIYVAIRFSKIGGFAAGTTAIVALIHDLIIIFGVFAICRFAIDGNFIAALLTILGYSVNDTVVIYDRVRENKVLYPSMEHGQLVNLSINQSLVRSINTTVSTIIALGTVCVVAFVAGLDSIVTFAFPLSLGMISGVYSTICIAGPLWVDYRKKFPEKEPEEETEE